MDYSNILLPLFTSIFFLGFSLTSLIFSKNEVKIPFSIFCLLTFHWQICWFFQFLLNNVAYADLIVRIGYSGIIFLPLLFYDSVMTYLGFRNTFRLKWFLAIGFIFNLFLWFSDLFIKGFYKYRFGFYPEAGLLHFIYLLIVTFVIISMVNNVYMRMKKSSDFRIKTQSKIFLVAIVVYCFASLDYGLNYPIIANSFLPEYPIGVFFIMLSMLIFIFAHFYTINVTLEDKVNEQTLELRKSIEKLKQLETAKKEFISNIAHDLKTPLSVIIGHASLLDSSENLNETDKMVYLSYIQQSVSRISYMIDRLITVAFIDEEDKPVLGLYEIYSFIKGYVSGFNEVAKNQEKNFSIMIPESEYAVVQIDPLWMERICGNIIHNALKYTQRGESVTVKMYQDSNHVFVQISDTGEGIESDIIPHIFERKTKYDDTAFRDRHSMGLGLFIVKEYINKLGGKIEVLSEKNKGSTFIYSIPLHPDQSALVKNSHFEGKNRRSGKDRRSLGDDRRQTERSSSFVKMISKDTSLESFDFAIYENRNPSKPTLLILEDTPGQLHLIIESLKDYYNLLFAKNGVFGLEKFQQHKEKIALILSDVKMPEMDGFEFCKTIFEDKSNEHIPFVFITAYFNREEEFQGIHLGASDYIQKPINIHVLREKINHWISRRHYETMLEDLNGTLEEKILQINKLQDIISHEIRNPLHVMKGSVYFINKLKDKLPADDEEIQKMFSRIETLSMGVESLISVLDLNKQITDGGTMFDSSLNSLQNLMDEVLEMTSHLLYNTDIRLNRSQDFTLLCNKRMLIQVFVNLIRNAAEAIKEKNPQRGLIDINILPLENNLIEIMIVDNGTGMNEETKKNLFKFKYTTKKNGTGIGLHFSKMIIKMHNGHITFNSKINEGTRFLITLPTKNNESGLSQKKD